jgi:hypothetical protein
MDNASGIAQFGRTSPTRKPWMGLGPAAPEIVEAHDGNAYRAAYTVRFEALPVFSVFAILGLRALYFLVAEVIDRFHYLKAGLSVVLVFVGLKKLAADVYTVPIGASLGFIVLVLAVAMAASWYWPRTAQKTDERDSLAGPDIRQNKSA